MRIISHNKLIEFFRKDSDAEVAMEEWYHKALKAEWNCFADVKNTFNSVDSVGNQRYVFNIKGNNYRIVAIVKFQIKIVYLRFVGTHSEYDNIKDIKDI